MSADLGIGDWAWFGAGLVSKLPKRSVQLGMGIALLIAAA